MHLISGDNSRYEAELLGAYLSKGQEGRHHDTIPEQADVESERSEGQQAEATNVRNSLHSIVWSRNLGRGARQGPFRFDISLLRASVVVPAFLTL